MTRNREWTGAGGPDVWDRHARSYDRQLCLEQTAIRSALQMLEPTSGQRWLDVGTGTGEVLRQLAHKRWRPRALTAIDSSPGMLSRLRPLPSGWVAELGDLRALPKPSGSFDTITASYVLHLLPARDLSPALDELRRVLRPGGQLLTVTPAVPAGGLGRMTGTLLDLIGRYFPEQLGGLRALDPRAALQAAGFDCTAVRWSLRGYPSLCVLSNRVR